MGRWFEPSRGSGLEVVLILSSFLTKNFFLKLPKILDISLKLSPNFSLSICFFLVFTGFPWTYLGLSASDGVLQDTNILLLKSEQILFITASPGETKGNLHFYTVEEGEWIPVFENIPVQLGKNGTTPAEKKREGDGHTPANIFPIQRVLGRDKREIRNLEYTKIQKYHHWSDSSNSKHYNQLIKHKEKGAVSLWDSEIYELFVVIEHNTKPAVPGFGSMIFLHPWNEDKPTSGCVGVSKDILETIVSKLDGKKYPSLVIQILE